MPTSFFQYEMLPTTWFYLSALMILAIFFKFNRFWSVRNLDLIGLIFLTPGLLFLAMYGGQFGYVWMFGIHLLILIRLLFDTVMVRRPLLEPNLTSEGLAFACFALFAFMIASVVINRGEQVDSIRTVRLEQILYLTKDSTSNLGQPVPQNPGYAPFFAWVEKTNQVLAPSDSLRWQLKEFLLSKKNAKENEKEKSPPEILPIPSPPVLLDDALLGASFNEPLPEEMKSVSLPMMSDTFVLIVVLWAHLMIVLGLLFIGHAHFGNIRVGIAAAALYLLHPYTNQMLGRIDHFVPAMLLVWAVVFYRRPFWSGLLIGLAAALVFYPIFLIPLWCGFYWKRGWIRFLCGIGGCYTVFLILLFSMAPGFSSFWLQWANLFGRSCFLLEHPSGLWEIWQPFYRIPVIALFLVFSFGMWIWPTRKHLATLVGGSTIIMLLTQFWQSYQGGLYIAWYLPLLILTVFRPNLEDRTASSTVVEARYWF